MNIRTAIVFIQCILVSIGARTQPVTDRTREEVANMHTPKEQIICFAPIATIDDGYSLEVSWEQFLGDWLCIVMPVAYSIKPNQYTKNTGQMFYLNPGVKIYTDIESYRRIKVSFSPSLFLGAGRDHDVNYSLLSDEKTRFLYGFMLTGGLNIFLTRRIYAGGDLGLGITSLNRYDGLNHDITVIDRLSLKIGYRFYNKIRSARAVSKQITPMD